MAPARLELPFETHKPLSSLTRRNGDFAMLLKVR